MVGNIQLLLPVLFPIIMGIVVLTGKVFRKNRKQLCLMVAAGLIGSWIFTLWALVQGKAGLKLWQFTDAVEIAFKVDEISCLFAGLTATVAKSSAGALNYTPVAKVTNISQTIRELKQRGIWFVCADMEGELMYRHDLTGAVGLVIGNEGEGVSRLVKEQCDFTASIPMKGDIDSLNASAAAAVLAYEIVRQRLE